MANNKSALKRIQVAERLKIQVILPVQFLGSIIPIDALQYDSPSLLLTISYAFNSSVIMVDSVSVNILLYG